MTLKQIKDRLKVIMSGQKNIWTDESYVADIIYDAVLRVCDKCIPVALLTNNPSLSSHRLLESGYFIRKPLKADSDGSVVDIDEELSDAVIYVVVATYANTDKLRAEYKHYSQVEIDRYNFRNYNSTEDLYEPVEIYERLIDLYMQDTTTGIYEVRRTLLGYEYRFYLDAVQLIDQFFLIGKDDGLSAALLDYIDEFAQYEDGELERDDLKALDALFIKAVSGETYENLCQV